MVHLLQQQRKWQSFSLILFIYNLLIFIPSKSTSMTLCEYYSNIGIYKPECHPIFVTSFDGTNNNIEEEEETRMPEEEERPSFRQHSSNFQYSFHRLPTFSELPIFKSSENEEVAPAEVLPEYEEHGLCKGFFHSCYESGKCESGTICSQLTTTKQCCTAPGSQCPSPTELNFNCRKHNPTSWCYADNDCNSLRTHKQLCCPTGCNYNICIPEKRYTPPLVGFHNIIRSAKMMSPDCPDPFSIQMRCHQSNPTSWCHTHSDCPSSQTTLHPRRCCPTPCGYNACFIRFDGTWVIG